MASIDELKQQSKQQKLNSSVQQSTREATQQKIEEMKKLKEQQKQQAAEEAIAYKEQEAKALEENKGKTPAEELAENYGFEHHEVVVDGWNISDSLHRRRDFANEQVAKIQKQMTEEDINNEIDGKDVGVEQELNNNTNVEPSSMKSSASEDELDDIEKEIENSIKEGETQMSGIELTVKPDENEVQEEAQTSTTKFDSEANLTASSIPEQEVKPQKEIAVPSNISIESLETVSSSEEPIEDVPTNFDEEQTENQSVQEEKVASPTQLTQAVSNVKSMINTEKPDATKVNTKIDDEDIKDIQEDLQKETTEDEMKVALEELKKQIAEKLGLNQHENITSVSSKGLSLVEAMSLVRQQENKIIQSADWVLVSAGRTITMKTWSGTELDGLNRESSGRNRVNTLREIFRAIYDHITSPKEDKFTDWLKNTSFFDIEHLYMTIYAACFTGKNYIPYSCEDPNCRHPFLSDNKDMDSMIYFEEDEDGKSEVRDRFFKIRECSDIKDPYLYKSKIEPIDGPIGIKFKEPSIYDTVFESSSLDETFANKYKDLIRLFVYMDDFYIFQNNEWHKVTYNVDPNSLSKSTKTKIVTWAKLMGMISSDGYQKINKIIDNIDILASKVKYKLPEEVCPKCGKPVAADPKANIMDATSLVFSRHQLARI